MTRQIISLNALVVLAIWLGISNLAMGQLVDDTFTYQGQLMLDGQPVTGPAQFAFYLWDAENGGSVVGSPLAMELDVAGGVFTADLAFDAPNFNGDSRWIEIAVRYPSGVGSYTFLTPRQPLRATPYAVTALEAISVTGVDGHSLDAADGEPTDALFVDNAGEVGIGTLNPLAPLDIRNDWVAMRLQAETLGASTFIDMRRADNSIRGIVGIDGPGFSGPKDQLSIATWTNHPIGFFTNAAQRLTISNTGNVGIGTSVPTNRLEVVGTARASIVQVGVSANQGLQIDNAHIDTIQGDPLLLQAQSLGPVGIGTSTPTNSLSVGGSANIELNLGIRTDSPNLPLTVQGINANSEWIQLRDSAGSNTWHLNGFAGGLNISESTVEDGRIYIQPGGNVGIGSLNPQQKLDVEGIVRCEAVILDGGADLSEGFDVHDDAQPGMVVVIDPTRPGALRVCESAYDAKVAGIISGAGGVKPGLRMGQANTIADGDHPVALTGRVYCWCDADANGAIQPGDMLTTSITRGHAMKADDRKQAFGATIGKAMTSLESGKGLVLVLVNLQ